MGIGIVGTIVVTPTIFDRWSDFKPFHGDITECCEILASRSGLVFEISEPSLLAAHTAWRQDYFLWLENLLPSGTRELSHLKKAALLLAKMCEFVPISVSGNGYGESPPINPQDGLEFPTAPNQFSASEIRKFRDGGCHFVSWLIIYHVCEFFEIKRTDRIDPYESRITEDFEIDMVSGLLSAKVSAQALHLVLKALFLRD
ncbi:MAG TPA: hypothetical protein VN838_02760 [Bradyrhizobium sp.]|nr:hypothetical protein [Bradyrhizobium sp.]